MRLILKRRAKAILATTVFFTIILVLFTVDSQALQARFVKPINISTDPELKTDTGSTRPRKKPEVIVDEIYDAENIKQIPYPAIRDLYQAEMEYEENINWDQYAYVNYVADAKYLCSTVIHFTRLHESGTKAKLVLVVNKDLLELPSDHETSKMLQSLRDLSGRVIFEPVENVVQSASTKAWKLSLTKMFVFSMVSFKRIIYFDSDGMIHGNFDELFFLPEYVQFAAPATYWFLGEKDLNKAIEQTRSGVSDNSTVELQNVEKVIEERIKSSKEIYNYLPNLPKSVYPPSKNGNINSENNNYFKYASILMVIKPEEELFRRIKDELLPKYSETANKFDMDLINIELYDFHKIIAKQKEAVHNSSSTFQPSILVLPYNKYGLLTGSIKEDFRRKHLSNDIIGYDTSAPTSFKDSKYYHFSDSPIRKPWGYNNVTEIPCKEGIDAERCKFWQTIFVEYFDGRDKLCKV